MIGVEAEVRTRNTLHAANQELRRVRKEMARGGMEPVRFVVAGDSTKPVYAFTFPRRLLALSAALALCAVVWPLVSRGQSIRALEAVSTAIIGLRHGPPGDPDEPLPERMYSEHTLTPKFQADAVREGEHFTVEISNTGKVVKVDLTGPAGEPDQESYLALRHELRCQRTGAESPIDPRLVELLHQIALESGQRIQVVSAFRAPTRPGEVNYHTKGMAADIRVPGLSTEELRDLARALGARGVGYYPTVQFVHVDVRATPYFWTDTSGHPDHSTDTNNNDQVMLSDFTAPAERLAVAATSRETAQAPAVPAPPSTAFVPTALPTEPLLRLPKQVGTQLFPNAPLH